MYFFCSVVFRRRFKNLVCAIAGVFPYALMVHQFFVWFPMLRHNLLVSMMVFGCSVLYSAWCWTLGDYWRKDKRELKKLLKELGRL